MKQAESDTRPHVVVVGGGFGGLEVTRRLRRADVRVSLVDRHNYHLFQPLLYQVATGGLSPANIAAPLRKVFRRQANCQVLLAEVTDIDVSQRRLTLADGDMDYDYVVFSAGATHSYFGNDAWEEFAPGLKSIGDATNIRRKIYLAFEAAERETDPRIRDELLTFVIVGGGPTGVELAGALSEIAQHTLRHDFRRIDPEDARILIVEAAPHILSHYSEELCRRAAEKVRTLNIEVHTETKVTEITRNHVRLTTTDGEQVIPTRTVLWAAGVQANPLGEKIATACGVETDRAGRVPVAATLNVDGHPQIFVIGDLAACTDATGKPMPGVAPVAIQQGQYVANKIVNEVSGRETKSLFKYKDPGTMATIGRAAAVAEIGKRQFCGLFAWILWLFVHLMQIVQFQNRVMILIQWVWNYVTFNRSARLITGEDRVVIVHTQSRQPEEDDAKPSDS